MTPPLPSSAPLPLVMGIVNVTPDSFSDGGNFLDPDAAVAHGRRLIAEGAAVVDVGGESTRPGADSVTVEEELRRVIPVIEALSSEIRVSIDTTKAEVARAAVAAGADLINDVSARLDSVAAELGVGWVAMHRRGTPATMQDDPAYDDVVGEVRDFLVGRAERAAALGVAEVWIDPGIGFGKTMTHNLSLLAHLEVLTSTGIPVVVGTSRKGFLGALHGATDGLGAPIGAGDRLEGSIATATWAMMQGARMVRAHDVLGTGQAARVVAA